MTMKSRARVTETSLRLRIKSLIDPAPPRNSAQTPERSTPETPMCYMYMNASSHIHSPDSVQLSYLTELYQGMNSQT